MKNETLEQKFKSGKLWEPPYDVDDEVFYYSPFHEKIYKCKITEVKATKDENKEMRWRFVVRFVRDNGLIDDNDTVVRFLSFDRDTLVKRFNLTDKEQK